MNLKRSPFSILNKERREIDYIKGVYKRKIQAEIESYKDPEDEDTVSYTHLRAHETLRYLVCRLLLEKKKNN